MAVTGAADSGTNKSFASGEFKNSRHVDASLGAGAAGAAATGAIVGNVAEIESTPESTRPRVRRRRLVVPAAARGLLMVE